MRSGRRRAEGNNNGLRVFEPNAKENENSYSANTSSLVSVNVSDVCVKAGDDDGSGTSF